MAVDIPKPQPTSKSTNLAKAEGDPGENKGGVLQWVLGWVVMPAVVIGLIFGAGVLMGVHMHDSWYTRLVVWVVELF
jgi:hypothetical protein